MEQVDVIVTERCGVAASKESTTAMTDVEQQQPLADGDAMLKCFSPLLSSMNMFGLYFTQASRHIQDASAPTSEAKDSQVPRKWTAGRIYALVIVVVAWLNTVRTLSAFEKRDKFGLVLFVKLASVAGGLFSALQHTACFVACQTGNLDRVFLDARLPKSDVARYRRLAVIHTIVCWVFLLAGSSTFVFSMFVGDSVSDLSMKIFDVNFLVSHQLFIVVEVINGLTFILTEYTWFFSHSVNYMITSVLCDQFRALNEDFNRAVGYGGEFRGSIRESRRRHQELSQSVQNTDRFMMISNTAGICCPIMNVILILYCALFFRDETIGQGEFSAITYVYWLASTLVGLTLTACQGVAVNHAAHCLTQRIHDVDLLSLDAQYVAEMNLFLHRLHGDPIGFSVLGIFVIEKNTMLTVLGLLVTYFLLVVQFGTPFEGATATAAVLTNDTFYGNPT